MSDRKFLFVFEGKKDESKVAESMLKIFSDVFSTEKIQCVYGNNIYNLHKQFDEDEYLDIFTLLKEMDINQGTLKGYNKKSFSDIYFFFDHDGHDTIASDNNLLKMIKLFNNATDQGKIYLSYPMVEALKHLSDKINFKDLTASITENNNYKKNVGENGSEEYKDFRKYDNTTWVKLIKVHLKKMNFIVNDTFSLPNSIISQDIIFSKQREKYISIDSTVAVLSAFPVFLLDYYGKNKLYKKVNLEQN